MTMTAAQLVALEDEILGLVDEAQAYAHIDAVVARTERRQGRPRVLSSRALLLGIQSAAVNGRYFIQEIPGILNGLSPRTKRKLGLVGYTITWRQVQYLITRIDRALRVQLDNLDLDLDDDLDLDLDLDLDDDDDDDDDERYHDFDLIFSAIATIGAHVDAMNSTSVAIDGSDIDTWARSHFQHKKVKEKFVVVKKVSDVTPACVRASMKTANAPSSATN